MVATPDQFATPAGNGSATTGVLTWATPPKPGTKVIVMIVTSVLPTGVADNGTPVTNFVNDANINAGGRNLTIWHADNVNPSGAYNVTASFSGSQTSMMQGASFWGVAPGAALPVNQVATASGSGTAVSVGTAPTGASSGNNALYVGGFGDLSLLASETITTTWGNTGGFPAQEIGRNVVGNAGYSPGVLAFRQSQITGAQTATWTLGDSVTWLAALCVYPLIVSAPPISAPVYQAGATPQQGDAASLWVNPNAFFQQRVVARLVQQNGTTSISNVAETTVGFDTALEDPYAGFNSGGSSWVCPANLGGWYHITATVFMAAAPSAHISLVLRFRYGNWLNTSLFTPAALTYTPLATTTPGCGVLSGVVYLAPQDPVFLQATLLNAGAALSTVATTVGQQSTMEFLWLFG